MRIATPAQLTEIEKRTASDFKLTPELLMENAGQGAAREIYNSFLPELQRGSVCVLVGPGHNGADAFVTARHLINLGIMSLVIVVVDEGPSSIFRLQRERVELQKLDIKKFENIDKLKGYDIYIDGLFGTGLKRDLEEPYISIINFLNSQSKPVVSLDVPSGLDSLSGQSYGAVVKAHITLTFGVAKVGLFTAHGSEFVGRMRVLPIGIPRSLIREVAHNFTYVNESWVRTKLPKRKRAGHKFDNGRIYILAGNPGSWGAAALCCQGAYRVGAGYVTLLTESKAVADQYLGHLLGPEVLLSTINDENVFKRGNAIIVGPGSGKTKVVEDFLRKLSSEKIKNVVVDADGLRVLAGIGNLKLPESWILTPHAGELSELTGLNTSAIESDRITSVQKASERWGCHVLLKGFRSVIATPEGQTLIIGSGNSALAKAGSGDVLSGFVGALLGQDVAPSSAVAVGAYIHGRVADQWIKNGGNNKTLVASDLAPLISSEFNRLENAF